MLLEQWRLLQVMEASVAKPSRKYVTKPSEPPPWLWQFYLDRQHSVWFFVGLNGDELIANLLLNLPGGKIGFMAISMLIIFFLGFFIDFFEIAFIAVPLLLPAARQLLGPDALLWLGVVIGANLQTSFLTPPFGFALFYLRGVAPKSITTKEIYMGALPFVALQIGVLCLIILVPALVNWLPNMSWS